MKKIVLSLAIVFSTMAAFASDDVVNATVSKSFASEFADAKNVTWVSSADFYKANFILNGQHVSAFYDTDGQLIGLTRNITSLEMPLKLQLSIRKDYADFWISDLFEISTGDDTEYYITLEKADAKFTLKSTNSNKWTSYKKTSK